MCFAKQNCIEGYTYAYDRNYTKQNETFVYLTFTGYDETEFETIYVKYAIVYNKILRKEKIKKTWKKMHILFDSMPTFNSSSKKCFDYEESNMRYNRKITYYFTEDIFSNFYEHNDEIDFQLSPRKAKPKR